MMRDYLETLLTDAGAVELRYFDPAKRIRSGIFDDLDALLEAVDGLSKTGNCYTTVNTPSLPATNRLDGRSLKDADIRRINFLLFDFDPTRPTGQPSTDEEMQHSIRIRDRFVAGLRAIGFPEPALGNSGNGAHAMYRVRITPAPENLNAMAGLYRGLAHDFGCDAVSFDTTVRNPSRIWRLYGTMNRKGASTVDRPHRMAEVVIPRKWEFMSPKALMAIAESYCRQEQQKRTVTRPARMSTSTIAGSGDYRTLDIVGLFDAHGLYRRPLGNGKHAIQCPWESEHSTVDDDLSTSTVCWEASQGWPQFKCSHAHCDGRGIIEVINVLGDADQFCARQFRKEVASC